MGSKIKVRNKEKRMQYNAIKQRLDAAIEAAHLAGEFLISNQSGDLKTTMKGRSDFVTVMDVESERIIKEHLHSLFPEDNFLGEEMGLERNGDGGTWVIDPIDGTTNYIRGLPGYTVSIAYEEERWNPIIGVVFDPILSEMFHAHKGGGAFLQGKPIYCSDTDRQNEAIVFTSPPMRYPKHFDAFMENYKNICRGIGELRDYGSAALHLAYVASGKGDAFIEYGLQYHDIAAGTIILEEAGGAISPIMPDKRSEWTGSIIATNLALHSWFTKTLQ
ncbi:MAG: inositol monophosphatase family protein [Sphaerochaetaceae bacterium]|jgi:myo-inositol-1(or 4)-monophosphatase|nr:inositol monophosphatase family protein [Sphaerochaetaceae bacterium]MDY0372407.1 inositol monophosphatase family protein [Sphaerochaetaceae bacterium]